MGRRQPKGKLAADPTINVLEVGEFQRMKEAVSAAVLHPVWVCQLWRMHHFGEISGLEREAGDRWIELVRDHKRFIEDSPPITAKVSRLERGYGRTNDPELTAEEMDRDRKLQDRWDAAFCAVVERHNGMALMRALNGVCVEDKVPAGFIERQLAREALKLLVRHFGLDKRNKP